MICNFNDETDSLDQSVLTDGQISKLCKAFARNSSANIKLSKT